MRHLCLTNTNLAQRADVLSLLGLQGAADVQTQRCSCFATGITLNVQLCNRLLMTSACQRKYLCSHSWPAAQSPAKPDVVVASDTGQAVGSNIRNCALVGEHLGLDLLSLSGKLLCGGRMGCLEFLSTPLSSPPCFAVARGYRPFAGFGRRSPFAKVVRGYFPWHVPIH